MGGLGDMFKFDKNAKDKDNEYNESYLIGIMDVEKSDLFYVLSPTRQEFAKLLSNLSTKRYLVIGVQMLNNVKDHMDTLKKLRDENKPEGLNFGKDE